MAGGGLSLVGFAGPCWRAVTAGAEATALAGARGVGRYHRTGERALYLSGSPAGVAAAMRRYGEAMRTVLRVEVDADRLVDGRNAGSLAALGICEVGMATDWRAALDRGEPPPSWAIADAVRASGAQGLIESSRQAPDEWHVVLFRWNEPDGARATVSPRVTTIT